MARYLTGEAPGAVPPELGVLFLPVNQTFVRSLAAFDAVAALAKVSCPVLIVQGDADIQVDVVDAERLHAAAPAATFHIIAGENHLLKRAHARSLQAQVESYTDPTVPIMPEVVSAVAEWADGLAR